MQDGHWPDSGLGIVATIAGAVRVHRYAKKLHPDNSMMVAVYSYVPQPHFFARFRVLALALALCQSIWARYSASPGALSRAEGVRCVLCSTQHTQRANLRIVGNEQLVTFCTGLPGPGVFRGEPGCTGVGRTQVPRH